jgi:AraC family transcriptional regulator of adaptative response / DNA-3-methyladenine glycosylase II
MSENGYNNFPICIRMGFMTQDNAAYYNAYASRDPRFDGVFYVGVTSTGVYCRPVCTAKTPKKANCRFFKSAAAAEKESFRPCLRCRPELAPGSAPVDDAHRIDGLITCRIEEGLFDDGAGMEEIASQFELSSRQIRRIVQKELGVSPMELVRTRRLLLAKQLLTETALPITEIAFASGFSSLHRFNDAFSSCYRMPPSRLRKETGADSGKKTLPETFTLQLSYRPPFDWAGIMEFLSARALKGVEWVWEDSYCRTVQLGGHKGWIHIRHVPEKHALMAEFSHALTPVLPALLGRLRNLFDLSARPDVIAERLVQDGILANAVSQNPGLRVPGAFDGFELAFRAVLGQQITVKAATTLAGRFVEKFGEKIETPYPDLQQLSPTSQRLASATVEELATLGIITTRARSIIALAQEISSGRLRLEAGAHPEVTIRQLAGLPGIGKWTAHYIAMRALRWSDAFPKEDIALRNSLGGISAARAEELSHAWRPWRSYATLYLWRNPVQKNENSK